MWLHAIESAHERVARLSGSESELKSLMAGLSNCVERAILFSLIEISSSEMNFDDRQMPVVEVLNDFRLSLVSWREMRSHP